jgi:hypothetical protein
MGINEIRFSLEPPSVWAKPGECQIVAYIDSVALDEMIALFETDAGCGASCSGIGVNPYESGIGVKPCESGPLEEYFHGNRLAWKGKTEVLGCVCGNMGCESVNARISVTDDLVIWDSFESYLDPSPDYSAFGPFRFQRTQYDDALRALSAAVSSGTIERWRPRAYET